MTFPLATRELIVAARRQTLVPAIVVYVGLLAAFMLVWSEKLPALTGGSFYESFRAVQTGLLLVVLPWTALRCAAGDRRDDIVWLSALTARPASSIVFAKVISLGAVAGLVAVAGVPIGIVAGKISAVPTSSIARDLVSVLLLGVVASLAAAAWTLVSAGPLTAWIGSSATCTILVTTARRLAAARSVQDALVAAVAIGGAAAIAAWSDRSFRYSHG